MNNTKLRKTSLLLSILLCLILIALATIFGLMHIFAAPAEASTLIESPILSGTHIWWNNVKQNGIYGDSYGVTSVPGARLSSEGSMNYVNGKYYTNNAILGAYYQGVTDDWVGVGSGIDTGANYGQISINDTVKKVGNFCEHKSGNYISGYFANQINNLVVGEQLHEGENTVSFMLQQNSSRVAWFRQDHREASVIVYYDYQMPVVTGNISHNGFTKSSFSVEATDNVGLSGFYMKRPNGTTETISGSAITINQTEANGRYEFWAKDYAGNSSNTYVVNLDTEAPRFDDVFSNYAFYKEKSFTFDTSTVKLNSDDEITVSYAKSTTSTFPSEPVLNYTSGTLLTEEGNYLFRIEDRSKNFTEYRCTIDKTAPTLSLSGVSNNGFTSGNVSASWSTTVGNVGSPRVNNNDVLTVTYARSDTKDFPTTTSQGYTSGTALSEAGNYLFRIEDSSKNHTDYKFTIDKTAPTLTLSGVTNNGFTSGNVSISWSTTVGNVGAQRVNNNDVLTVTYARSEAAAFPTTTSQGYTSGTALSEAGNYLVRIEDSSKNHTDYKFTIDKTAPTLTLSGVTNNGFTSGNVSASWSTTVGNVGSPRVNSNDVLTVTYARSETAAFPTTTTQAYASSTELSEAGNYLFRIEDSSKNHTDYKFTIDKTAPTLFLSGVSNNGFTSGNVSASWSTTVGNVGSPRVNNNDVLAVTYARSDTKDFPTTTSQGYTSGTALSEAGNYLVRIEDSSKNHTDYKFTIDKTAPTLTLSGVTNNGFTSGNVSISWSTTVGNVGAQRVNSNDVLTVTYARSETAAFPATATQGYSSGTKLSEEGNYLFRIEDSSKNHTEYKFTIDKTAPTLTLSGVSNGGITNSDVYANWVTDKEGVGAGKQLTNYNDSLTVLYAVETSKYEYPGKATTQYNQNTLFTSDSYVVMTISDAAQNVTTYRFVIDKTAPTANVPAEYINKAFSYSATDPHGVEIEYRFNNSTTTCVLQSTVYVDAEEQSFGSWEFRAIDDVGNATKWSSVKLFIRDTFGNIEQIKNDFKVPTWYTVKLPKRIYTDNADTYSFADYETALNFGIAKEWEYRVESLAGGKWSYVNVTNESVTQIYDDKAVLDSAVLKYAKSYISDRYTFGVYGNDVKNPTDSNFVTRPDAMTLQTLQMPELLGDYAGLPIYFISHKYQFSTPIIGVPGNRGTATIKFISDGYRLQSGNEISIVYNEKLKTILENAGAWKFGYYLITESDPCGNQERYVVCLDTMLPELTADIIEGNGNSATLTFDSAYTTVHSGVMLYTSFSIKSLYDSLDSNVAVMLEGRGFSGVIYTDGDEFPTLCYENGNWGTYNVTVYDRSLNAFSFSVKIAGEPMSVKHSSLASDTQCTLTIVNNDYGNAMTAVGLYKVTFAGDYIQLDSDDDGTAVSVETFTYVLRNGGKYVLRITDIFGRVIETEPMFFLKGLPTGLLRGVKDGGITNKDVTFEYASDTTVILYVWDDSRWEEATNFMSITEKEGYSIASVTASESSSRLFKFFLYLTSDRNLFVEYRFEIDCIAPVLEVFASDGEKLSFETVTQKDFRTTWDESNLTVYYYRADDVFGSLGEKKYTKDTVLNVPGTYVFTAYDTVKNTTVCRMTLDNVVSYSIEGVYSILKDGSLITKNGITLTVTERTAVFECENTNAISVQNGNKLTIDGTYNYRIEDMYGNLLKLAVIVDNLPPTPKIMTIDELNVVPNGTTNRPFLVSCDEDEVSILIMNGTRYEAYDGEFRSAENKYTFKMSDRMNNVLTFTITIDLTVNVIMRGNYVEKNGVFFSRGGLSISANEPIMSFSVESDNGNMFGVDDKITAEDRYTTTIIDTIGNVLEILIVIDQTPPTPTIVSIAGDDINPNGKINMPFVLSCDEEDSVILWAKKNGVYSAYFGQQIEEIGEYSFKISDLVKNEFVFTVEYDVTVSYSVAGTYVRNSEGHYISRTGLVVTMNEEYSRFSVASNCGHTFALGEKVVIEGEYVVTIEDSGKNIVTIYLIIDLTAPTPIISDADGNAVEKNGIVQTGVLVGCEELGATIENSKNGKDFTPYNGTLIEEPGKTYFRLTDMIGNSTVFEITVDRNVDFSVNGKYIIDYQGRYVSNSGLTVIVNEKYTRFSVVSNCDHTFAPGEKVVIEGEYVVTIEDSGNNFVIIYLIIDLTAPTPIIFDAYGNTVEKNGIVQTGVLVGCEELGATIENSKNGKDFTPYNGTLIEEPGKTYFRLTDMIGNSTVFEITVDSNVDFSVNGKYVIDYQGRYVSNSGLTVTVNEEYSRFSVASNCGHTFAPGEKVVIEGEYVVTIEDSGNNFVIIYLIIDLTAPTPKIVSESGKSIDENTTTNESFTVTVDERGATIEFSTDGKQYSVYDGAVLSAEKNYKFRVYDFVGNLTTFSVIIDKSVAYKIKGTYEVFEGDYYTRLGVTVEPEEELKIFEVTSKEGNSFALGDKVTKEDTYAVRMADLYGNELTVKIIVDFTAPDIELIGVNENNAANDSVTVIVKDFKRITCRRAGQDDTLELSAQTVFEEAGDYTITAVDHSNNVSSVAFKIDKSVDVMSDIQFVIPGQYITGSVRFTFNEKMGDVQLVKDDVSIGYNGGVISEVGNYVLTVSDKVGNLAMWNWRILPAKAREYRLSLPQGFNVSATKDGAATNVMGSEELLLDKDGEYVLRFANGDVEYTVVLHVDTVPPTVQIDQLRDNVVISAVSKSNVKLMLYCDGKAVEYSIGQKITTTGDYRLVVTDELGNVSEYNFSLHYINGFGIAVIVIGSALVLAFIVVVVMSRLRQKVK